MHSIVNMQIHTHQTKTSWLAADSRLAYSLDSGACCNGVYRHRWAVPRYFSIAVLYRGTFLVPVPSVLWKKSTGTAVPVLLFLNLRR